VKKSTYIFVLFAGLVKLFEKKVPRRLKFPAAGKRRLRAARNAFAVPVQGMIFQTGVILLLKGD